jgi:hypothetical protein
MSTAKDAGNLGENVLQSVKVVVRGSNNKIEKNLIYMIKKV